MKSKINNIQLIKNIDASKMINILFLKKEQSLSIVLLLMLFSFSILFIRVSITKTWHYLFLVWNVFLASIPYLITIYLSDLKKLKKISFCMFFLAWLASLPNAPYIVTDLFHLSNSSFKNMWIDTLVISSFAITGMLLFYFSLFQIKILLLRFFNIKTSNTIVNATIFLSAFGVYIGRFLRFNSWDILSNPIQLLFDIFNMILHPITNKDVWLFTFSFGFLLLLGHYIFSRLNSKI